MTAEAGKPKNMNIKGIPDENGNIYILSEKDENGDNIILTED